MLEKGSNLIRYGSMDGLIDPTPGATENVSNVTRMAAIHAGLSMFRERPLLGVGLGQYGFAYPYHIRAEDLRSYEVRVYATGVGNRLCVAAGLFAACPAAGRDRRAGISAVAGDDRAAAAAVAVAVGRRDLSGPARLAVAMTLSGWLMLGASIEASGSSGAGSRFGVGLALWRVPRKAAA